MKVTYYGHSCFAAQVANKTLLFDPFITGNELAKAIDVQALLADVKAGDTVLIQFGHNDAHGAGRVVVVAAARGETARRGPGVAVVLQRRLRRVVPVGPHLHDLLPRRQRGRIHRIRPVSCMRRKSVRMLSSRLMR